MKKFFKNLFATVIVFTLLFSCAMPAMAAVAISNSASDTDQGSGTVSYNNNGDFLFVNVNSNFNTVSAMTYNGVAMTELGTQYFTTWSGRYHNTFYLVNPATGTHDIVTTGGANWQFVIFSATGVDQTTPTSGLTTKADTTSTNPTIAITTTVDNAFAIASGQMNGSSPPSAGANTTQVLFDTGGAFGIWRSTNAVSPAGAFTINVTANSGDYRFRGFGLNPAIVTSVKTANGLAKASVKTKLGIAIANIKSFLGLP